MKSEKLRQSALVAVLSGACVFGSIFPANACAFDDPIQLSKGLLNLHYPESLHVTGAVWEAQKAGILPMPDKRRFTEDSEERERFLDMAFQDAVRGLLTIGTALDRMPSETAPNMGPNLAIVLVDSYLWARIEPDGKISIHEPGADTGDLVIVTDAPVIRAVVDGNLSIAEALDMGVMKLYGSQDQVDVFTASKADLGSKPLREADWEDAFRHLAKLPEDPHLSSPEAWTGRNQTFIARTDAK